ncbi:hypothetical protein WDU94_015582 [Cyamophila willieti]
MDSRSRRLTEDEILELIQDGNVSDFDPNGDVEEGDIFEDFYSDMALSRQVGRSDDVDSDDSEVILNNLVQMRVRNNPNNPTPVQVDVANRPAVNRPFLRQPFIEDWQTRRRFKKPNFQVREYNVAPENLTPTPRGVFQHFIPPELIESMAEKTNIRSVEISGVKAPAGDLSLLKKLNLFKKIDPDIANAVLKKFKNHLWYLSDENLGFAFFDDELSDTLRIKMVKAQEKPTEEDESKKFEFNLNDMSQLLKKDVDYFITAKTSNFFSRFGLNIAFLKLPPSMWQEDESYMLARM